MTKHFARLVAAALLAAATAVLLPGAPAQAAACPGATGVTVIVDYKQLGGGIAQGCASTGGGKTATTNFPAAGFPLSFVQRSPGFVCRVSGKPAADPCVNTPPVTAYWSLWWSDGKSGTWTYSTLGAGSLKVPTGGYLAFSWQGQAAKAAPGVAPKKRVGVAAAAAAPTPASAETKSPSKSRTKNSDKSRNAPEPTPSPETPSETETPPSVAEPVPASEQTTAQKKAARKARKAGKASASATPAESPVAEPAAQEAEEAAATVASDPPAQGGKGGRVPMWVAMPLLLALVGAIGGVTVWRGRRNPSA